jgi:HEAT repeat protein
MLRRRKLLWAVVALCAALTAWTGYEHWFAPKGPSYRGKTAAQWQAELRCWEPLLKTARNKGGRWTWWVYFPPTHEVWLAKFGVSRRDYDAKLALVEGDPEAVPVLLELLKSPSPKARRAAAQGLEKVACKAPQFPPAQLDAATQALLAAIDDEDQAVRLDAEQALFSVDREAAEKAGLGRRSGNLP